MIRDDRLPRDAQSILELAARSMFELFANASEGMMLVDRNARVVWINDQYRRFLPALGFQREEDFVGHPVSSVVQNTQMHQVLATGKPILIDLLTNKIPTLTEGFQGSNESPSVAPNGRHIAFVTSQWGKEQIAIIGRDGKLERRVTTSGNNRFPSWSHR